MVRLLLAAVCLTALIFGCFADKEYVEHGHHHHAHDGHDHHDHESHKKLFAGDDMGGNEAEQRERLRTLSKKIDTDKNGQISSDELRVYIAQRINEQRQREVDEFVGILDPDQTGKVSFDAYIKDNFGDLDIEKLEATAATDPRSRETRRTYIAEKKKWQYLDKDGDNLLTYEELRQFLRPEDIEDLRRIEIDSIINEYDLDKDGKVSRDEYLKMTEAETGQAEALGDEIDKNNDGFGDFDELARYYLPLTSVVADEETEHLLKDCDTDKDGICTPDEIVNAYSSFAGSQITDFGADLENDKEEL